VAVTEVRAWKTSDGTVHTELTKAVEHEKWQELVMYLQGKCGFVDEDVIGEVVTALLKKYDFFLRAEQRSENGSEAG